MTRKPRKPVTAKEWVEQLEQDPAWVARRDAQDRKLQALEEVFRADEAALLADLRSAGFDVDSVYGLFNRKKPWRTDVPIPDYAAAMPILADHLLRPLCYVNKEGIVRALTDNAARFAFDRIVAELRRTADPRVATEEMERLVELVMHGIGDAYTLDEVERFAGPRWDSYRFALSNAVGFLFGKQHLGLMATLLRDEQHGFSARFGLARHLRTKLRRRRINDPEIERLLDQVARERPPERS